MTEPEQPPSLADIVPRPQETFSWGRVIGAFFLTLLAIPLLFVATCIPFAEMGVLEHGAKAFFTLFGTLFTVGAIIVAVRTSNPGMRWGIIFAIAVAAGVLIYVFAR